MAEGASVQGSGLFSVCDERVVLGEWGGGGEISVAGGQAPLGDPICRGGEWPRLSKVWGWLIEDEREGGRSWGCYWIWPLPHIQYMPHTHAHTRQGVIQKLDTYGWERGTESEIFALNGMKGWGISNILFCSFFILSFVCVLIFRCTVVSVTIYHSVISTKQWRLRSPPSICLWL